MTGLRWSSRCRAWGTALAKLLAAKGVATRIWAYEPEVVDSTNAERDNAVFLSGIRLPESLRADGDQSVLGSSAIIVNAVPTQHIRSVYGGMDQAAAEGEARRLHLEAPAAFSGYARTPGTTSS